MRGFAAVVVALAVAGCGSDAYQGPEKVMVPPSAECVPATPGQSSCTWTEAGCSFRALVEDASGEVITADAWC